MPKITPTKQEIIDKCISHPHDGGWLAHDIVEKDIDAQEPDFSDVNIFQHEHSLYLIDRLRKQYIQSPNRKSYVPGDLPDEVWRILLNSQWLIKGYIPKWGIGHEKSFLNR